jgi:hypothetical protein
MNLEIRTRRRGGTDTCPACKRDRDGGHLGEFAYDLDGNVGRLPRAHTCLDYESAGQAATRDRARRLAQLNQRVR